MSTLVNECAERDLFQVREIIDMLKSLTASLERHTTGEARDIFADPAK
jgi:hypothetical protein